MSRVVANHVYFLSDTQPHQAYDEGNHSSLYRREIHRYIGAFIKLDLIGFDRHGFQDLRSFPTSNFEVRPASRGSAGASPYLGRWSKVQGRVKTRGQRSASDSRTNIEHSTSDVRLEGRAEVIPCSVLRVVAQPALQLFQCLKVQ